MNAADRTFAPCNRQRHHQRVAARARVPAHTRPVPPPPPLSRLSLTPREQIQKTRELFADVCGPCGRRCEVALRPGHARGALRLVCDSSDLSSRCGDAVATFHGCSSSLGTHCHLPPPSWLLLHAPRLSQGQAHLPTGRADWTRWRPPSTAVYRW